MKNIFSIIILLFSLQLSAQNAIADLKFEEAEIAFNKGENTTTITKLDEFDKLLGSVTAKSLYLRIITQNAILDRRVNYRTFGFNYTPSTGASLKDPVTILKPFKEGINPEIQEFDLLLSVDGTEVKEIKEFIDLLNEKYGEEYDGGNYAELIIKRNNITQPIKLRAKLLGGFYAKEDNYDLLASLRKNVNAYLKAMESEGLDEKFRDVYAISENLKKYPNDKKEWLKKKQQLETQRLAISEEEKRKEEEIEKYYREIAPKIDAWEWNEGIKIDGNFEELKKQYPTLYHDLKKSKSRTYSIYTNKISLPETINSLYVGNNDDLIGFYTITLANLSNKSIEESNKEMVKCKQYLESIFGKNLIYEVDNNVLISISSPYSRYRIEVKNDYISIMLVKSKNYKK